MVMNRESGTIPLKKGVPTHSIDDVYDETESISFHLTNSYI